MGEGLGSPLEGKQMAWSYNRNNIIERALRLSGNLSYGGSADINKINAAATALQSIIENLHNDGYMGSQLEWVTKTFIASSTVTGYRCFRSHTSDTSNQPGVGANWESYWIADSTATGLWTSGTAYSAIGDFLTAVDTLEVIMAYIRNGGGDNDDEVPLSFLNEEEYHSIGDKYTTGMPEYIYVENKEYPRIYLYYQPDSTDYIINYLRIKKIVSIDSASSTLDMEKRWWEAITYALAADIDDETQLLDAYRSSKLQKKAEYLMRNCKKKDFYRGKGNTVVQGAYQNNYEF